MSRSESPSGIRARYRDLVRTLHPDVAGRVVRVLSRRSLRHTRFSPTRRPGGATTLSWTRREGRPPVESIEPLAARRREPVSLLAEPQAVRPFCEALVEPPFRNFTRVGIPKAERPEGLTVGVILTPEEAVRGVGVPISVPSSIAARIAVAPFTCGFPLRLVQGGGRDRHG
jgi:hypothetical protein